MMLTIIAALGANNALGKNNDLPWSLPDDFKRFKELTFGHPMIMGRKTFETLPGFLPGRRHIVISNNSNYKLNCSPERGVCVSSLQEALEEVSDDERPFVIGGGEIYLQALRHASCMELTRVHHEFEADTFFPVYQPEKWECVRQEEHPADKRHAYAFTYETFHRVPLDRSLSTCVKHNPFREELAEFININK